MNIPGDVASPDAGRRSFLRRAGLGALGLGLASCRPQPRPTGRRVLRAAHLTDIHVQPEHGAPAGMTAALRHAQGLEDRPEILLFGGDCIGDAMYTPMEKVLPQWEIWQQVLAAEVSLPAYQCLGNHDIHGWMLPDRTGLEPDAAHGKALALEKLGLASSYYSFDRAGWHFVVLDSMQYAPNDQGYEGRLDEAQFAWLARDLAATPPAKHICVLTHIPILSAAAFFDGATEKDGMWHVRGAWMHIDARRIKDLFRLHPNVKLCLSGHLHLVDDVTYLGVRYLCNGAVCGNWWKGSYQEFAPAYAVIDFFDDGHAENQIVCYDSAPAAPEPGPAARKETT